MRLIQHVKSAHDINGNPRRLYLVTTPWGVINAYDEGYQGEKCIPYSEIPIFRLPSINVSPSEWKRLLKQYPAK